MLTDHKPITRALISKTARSPRQERQLSYIAQCSIDIKFISGADTVVAGVFSCASSGIEEPMILSALHILSVDITDMADEQCRDPWSAIH